MKTEKTLFVIFIIAIIFKTLHWPGSAPLAVFSMGGISLLYFPAGFYFLSDKNIKNQNLAFSIIAGIFLSTSAIGILMKFINLLAANVILIVGAISLLFLICITFILKSKREKYVESSETPKGSIVLDEISATDQLSLNTYYHNLLLRLFVFEALSVLAFFYLY